MPSILIFLATYNGEFFLEEFLKSAIAQSMPAQIIARDDASTDGTVKILEHYADHLTLLKDDLGNLGVLENFNRIAQSFNADYVALADQDDVWVENKLWAQLQVMEEMEQHFGFQTPILVHSDLAVIDPEGRVRQSSFWRFQRLDPQAQAFNRILVQNNVTGCTALINRALKELAFPVPSGAVMHDWWLALVAAAAGKIGFTSEPLVWYRQHGANQVGAVSGNLAGAVRRILTIDPRASLRKAQRQARAFRDRFQDEERMAEAVRLADLYAGIGSKSYPRRLWTLYAGGFWMQAALRNLGLVFFI